MARAALSARALDGTRGYEEVLAGIAAREAVTRDFVVAHEENVARTAVAIAREAGMSEGDVATLAAATRFHDVGKMSVPTEILRKPGRLSTDEWSKMRSHAADGAARLAGIPGIPRTFVDVARFHHERYDGFGYEGLVGEDIPLAARIVAIADVHDALGERRDYKPPMREDEVLVVMTADTPSPAMGRRAFDPVLMRLFVAMRIADPTFECSPETRFALAEFASSTPDPSLGNGAEVPEETPASHGR